MPGKFLTTLFLLLSVTGALRAQTLTANNCNPIVGQTFYWSGSLPTSTSNIPSIGSGVNPVSNFFSLTKSSALSTLSSIIRCAMATSANYKCANLCYTSAPITSNTEEECIKLANRDIEYFGYGLSDKAITATFKF